MIIFLAMAIFLVHLFVLSVFVVQGASMEPNFFNGEYLLTNKLNYKLGGASRGDIVVFKFPGELKQRYIKRVIGLPGDTVKLKNDQIYLNGHRLAEPYLPISIKTSKQTSQTEWVLKEQEYFVLGDNRENSNDSRTWGILPAKNLIGKISKVVFPAFSRRIEVLQPNN